MRSPEELRALVDDYVGDLALTPELHGQAESVRYALVGGKRVRGVICLATAEAAGAEGLARVELDDIVQQVREAMWQPEYRRIQAC